MAAKAVQLSSEIETLNEQIAVATAQLQALLERELPEFILGSGFTRESSFGLPSGQTLKIKQMVFASLPKKSSEASFKWLVNHGYGSMIKADVKVTFDRDGLKDAKAALAAVKKCGGYKSAALNQSVHHQTLQAWARNMVEKDEKLPPNDVIPITVKNVAVIA